MTALALDVGGTKLAAAVAADDGTPLEVRSVPVPRKDVWGACAGLLREVAEIGEGPVTAVGIAAAGPVDTNAGTIGPINISEWSSGFALVDAVRSVFPDARVDPVMDGAAATLAEQRFGAGRDVADLLGVVLGTGIGGDVLSGSLFGRSLFGSGRSSLRRRLLGRLRLRVHGLEHQLDDGHGGVVTLAVSDLGDAGVAALTLRDQRCDLGEEDVDDLFVTDDREHPTTGVQVAALGERDETLGQRTQALGFGLGGLDRLVREQRRGEVRKQQALVGGTASEAGTLGGLGHVYYSW